MLPQKIHKLEQKSSDFIIRVVSQDNSSIQGHLEHIKSGQVASFDSCIEMILQIHRKLEELKHPQSTTTLRTWKD
ncbi:MAG: hypothetical protein APF84_09890 [Gracilibacter sp. BRH_c7a]|nr:MAG: hypothetical protein APF84_09890 [Gracilibacter sp. BRH_c7a]